MEQLKQVIQQTFTTDLTPQSSKSATIQKGLQQSLTDSVSVLEAEGLPAPFMLFRAIDAGDALTVRDYAQSPQRFAELTVFLIAQLVEIGEWYREEATIKTAEKQAIALLETYSDFTLADFCLIFKALKTQEYGEITFFRPATVQAYASTYAEKRALLLKRYEADKAYYLDRCRRAKVLTCQALEIDAQAFKHVDLMKERADYAALFPLKYQEL